MRSKMAISFYGWILLLLMATFAAGQEGKRLAVIVGINEYADASFAKLEFADADASAIATLLKNVGYEVMLLTDSEGEKDASRQPTKVNIEAAIKGFTVRTEPVDTALIAFIGHGVYFSARSENYFCPRDAELSVGRTDTMIALSNVYSQLDGSRARIKVLIADACRNDPKSKWGAGIDASTAPQPPQNMIALFSCSKDERSYEHKIVKHGFFTHFLLEGMSGAAADPDGEVPFDLLANYVKEPMERVIPQFIDGKGRKQTPILKANATKSSYIFLSYGELENLRNPVDVEKRPDKFTNSLGMKMKLIPAGSFVNQIEESLIVLRRDFPRSLDWEFGKLPVQKRLRIEKPFYLGTHEVTFAQFQKFVDSTGYKTDAERDRVGGFGYDADRKRYVLFDRKYTWKNVGWPQTDEHPVVNVSWNDAMAFCLWLSQKESAQYRLPTEAEWEYACRAGTQTYFWFGYPRDAILSGNIRDEASKKMDVPFKSASGFWDGDDGYPFTAPVGKFAKNAFGLYDTFGNVSEWCSDIFEDKDNGIYSINAASNKQPEVARALRGGNWGSHPASCRSSARFGGSENYRNGELGFRLVCSSAP